MGKRSPVLGYNHNFKHRGLIFHVQTEDSGVDNPHLFTHLFHGGVIISSRRMDYDADSEVETVKSLMQSQHKAVLKDLKVGTFDEKIDLYLGHKPELEPRKGGATPTESAPAEPAPAAPSSRQATVADVGPPSMMPNSGHTAAERREIENSDTMDVHEAARAAAAQHLDNNDTMDVHEAAQAAAAALHADSQRAVTPASPQQPAAASPQAPPRQPSHPETMQPSSAIHLDIPNTNHSRPRVPTPMAVEPLSEEALGEPMVTFAAKKPSQPVDAPSAVPTPIEELETSGSYHMRRPKSGAAETVGRQRTAFRSSREPTPAKARPVTPRASGKSANPKPGRSRSSVVVSRPAVIIGAPPSIAGDKNKQRAPAARKARDGNLFGKDMISEKSLDEVIMAYLSEDGSED